MKHLLILIVVLIPSCTVLENLKKTSVSAAAAMEKVDLGIATIDKGLAKYEEARAAADTNRDGKTDSSEWMTYLLGLLGVGGAAGGGLLARNAKSNARKDVMEARLDRIESATP